MAELEPIVHFADGEWWIDMTEEEPESEIHMAELDHIEIERVERDKYRFYGILPDEDKMRGRSITDATHFTPGELLELAAYVEQNRAQLEQESREDEERNAAAWSEDMRDMEQIKREWRAYRDEGTGA